MHPYFKCIFLPLNYSRLFVYILVNSSLFQFREKRLEQEKEQLEKQVEWLNNQLTEKTNQLCHVRKEKVFDDVLLN